MSYGYGYSIKRQAQRTQRPVGVAILATLGVLSGLAAIVLVLIDAYLRLTQGVPPITVAGYVAIGLCGALVTIWIYWSLWDLMGWAWFLQLVLNGLNVGACVLLLVYAPTVMPLLGRVLPLGSLSPMALQFGLVSSTVLDMVVSLCVLVYLFSVREAFGVGVRRRVPWESR